MGTPGTQRTAVLTSRAAQTFQALRHRNFLLLWTGTIVSQTGRWVMITAQGWLMYEVTHSAFMLGMVGFCNAVPSLFLSPIGGVLADRMDKRRLLLITQFSMMVLVLVLATLATAHVIKAWHVLAIAVLTGAAMAFDMPARQALLPEIVGKEDITNAVALNSSVFHGTRIWGPTIAGLLVVPIGTGGCFYLTGASYAGIIGALLLMKIPPRTSRARETTVWANMVDGFSYIRTSRIVLILVMMAAVFSIFGTAQRSIMPIFAGDILKTGPSGFGLLMGASGVGALIAALAVAPLGTFKYKGPLLLVGAFVRGLTLLVFATSTNFNLSLATLFVGGASETVYMTMSNSILLISAPEDMSGRVMSAYTMTSSGLAPFGALQGGTVADFFGAPLAIGMGGTICAICAFVMVIAAPTLRRFR